MLARWRESGDGHIPEAMKGESVQKGQAAVPRAKEVKKLRVRGAEGYPHRSPPSKQEPLQRCGPPARPPGTATPTADIANQSQHSSPAVTGTTSESFSAEPSRSPLPKKWTLPCWLCSPDARQGGRDYLPGWPI